MARGEKELGFNDSFFYLIKNNLYLTYIYGCVILLATGMYV